MTTQYYHNFVCLIVSCFLVTIFVVGIIIQSNVFDAFDDINTYIIDNPTCNIKQSKYYNRRAKSFYEFKCHNATCNALFLYTVRCMEDNDNCSPKPIDGCFVKDDYKMTQDFLSCIDISMQDVTLEPIAFTDCYENVKPEQLMISTSSARILFIVLLSITVCLTICNYTPMMFKFKNTDIYTQLIGVRYSSTHEVTPLIR
jgi:hypothetical protein